MQEKLRTEGIPWGKKTSQLMVLRKLTKEKNRKKKYHWRGLLCPSPDLPNPGFRPAFLVSPAMACRFFTTVVHGEFIVILHTPKKKCSPSSYGTTSVVGCIIMWKNANRPTDETFIYFAPPPKIYFLPVFQMHIIWS